MLIIFYKKYIMKKFLNKIIDWDKFELKIDKDIFNKDIVLKSAYNFLDKWYFFFKLDENWNIILQFTPKNWITISPETIILEFSDELLAVYLRYKLEKDNKVIRETIVIKAINWPLDMNNFVTLDTDNIHNNKNQIDFDKDIDEILKEIENDPELQIDEEEIERILKEIEEETEEFEQNNTPSIDLWAISDIKNKFKSNK